MAGRKIRWSSEAEITYAENLKYLDKRWGRKVVREFLDSTDATLLHIAKNPLSFKAHDTSSNIRVCVLHKVILVYFTYSEEEIFIITFWNTYQSPDSLNL